MFRRSRAREVALQCLFWREADGPHDAEAVKRFVRGRLRDPQAEPFCWRLIDGVEARRVEIDSQLATAAENWRLPRMAAVDRNVLRIGAFELLDPSAESPPAVAINEAIELARRYGSADSPKFVNGVLDKVHRQRTPQPDGDAAPETPSPSAEPE